MYIFFEGVNLLLLQLFLKQLRNSLILYFLLHLKHIQNNLTKVWNSGSDKIVILSRNAKYMQ